ncbi:hypothetical protein JW899_03635 [Candidatus Uhrbacteria bacterium]|nr:hypothetical protein [Candidatus Uhrbacteria bacterium]
MTNQNDTVSFHRRLIRQGLTVSWKHKHLWIFGFFAAFSGFGGVFEPVFQFNDRIIGTVPFHGEYLGIGFMPGLGVFRSLVGLSLSPWMSVAVFGLLFLIGLAVAAVAVVMALGATVSGTKAVSEGRDLGFSESLKGAAGKFWTLLGIVVAVKAISLVSVLVTGISLVNFREIGGPIGGMFFLLSFLTFLTLAVVVAIVGIYAVTAAVDGRTVSVREAIRDGWRTFAGNWLVSLEAGALVLATQFVLILLVIGAVAVAMVPFFVLMLLALYFDLVIMGTAIAILASVAVVMAMCLTASFLTVFQVSVWWQLWREFGHGRGLIAGLERHVGSLLKRLRIRRG